MMTNLFSIFDPSTSSIFSLNWITILSIIIIPSPFWITPSRIQMIWKMMFKFISIEMKANLSNKTQKFLFLLVSLFSIIMLSNLLGLIPYVFTPSSHIMFSMAFAFPIWISLMLYGWINHFNKMMIHLVPMGSPGMLTIFMVLIETISNVIRPITLSVRLSANMISGHLLIHLLTSIPYNSNQMFMMIMPIIVALMFLESAVALIQSYVFITLVSLYTNEI
uniref:ATP synthase subunit a n=1 Tax=Ixodes holocyclus TaxID=65647 RepID=Q76LP5_IXOHO|nr:ATP synthase F0 subunit 6 [Ixodes holocyclus]QAB05889.1 ATP synthase F0 subunit 6 [Ixodes holocyclus]QAB05902.1 ATP synthase F0 subunit 6 [Ixodes holocyclus]QAB05915.1 ATP synthase F0 subunit 6 [Ixodes holocyclus]BAD04000.1 ATPase 6 [Ixodes holocyclus]